MCAKLSDLGLSPDPVGEALDYASMPDQMGGFPDPPYPGAYRFRFPPKLDAIWETFDHTTGKPPGKRVRARFDQNTPLTIIQSPDNAENGNPFTASISNAERPRGRKEDPTTQIISDMDYINRDVWGLTAKPGRGSNADYATEFMKHAGTEFGADIEWNWFCNPRKNIYTDNGSGGYTEVQQAGCNASYYQKDIKENGMLVLSNPDDPNSPKRYPLRITCACGANIRAFPNLLRFRA